MCSSDLEIVGIGQPGVNGLERRQDGADLAHFLNHAAGAAGIIPERRIGLFGVENAQPL